MTADIIIGAFKAMDEDGDMEMMKKLIRKKIEIPGRIDIFLDTETSGLSKYDKVIQLGYIVKYYEDGKPPVEVFTVCDYINVPCTINPAASRVHGITRKMLNELGEDQEAVYSRLLVACNLSRVSGGKIIAFNASFDKRMMGGSFDEYEWECAMAMFRGLGEKGKLSEIYSRTFDAPMTGAHDALCDVRGMIQLWEYFECHV